MEVQRDGEIPGVHPLLQLGNAADAAHEVDVLVAPRVLHVEDRAQYLVLADRAIKALYRIALVVRAFPDSGLVPLAREVDAKFLGSARRRGGAALGRLDI